MTAVSLSPDKLEMSMIRTFRRRMAMAIVIVLCLGIAPCQTQASEPAAQRGHVLVVPQGHGGAVVDRFVSTTGATAKEATTAAVRWDDDALTTTFTCEDAETVATHTDRDDRNMWQNDSVEVFLDPGHPLVRLQRQQPTRARQARMIPGVRRGLLQ